MGPDRPTSPVDGPSGDEPGPPPAPGDRSHGAPLGPPVDASHLGTSVAPSPRASRRSSGSRVLRAVVALLVVAGAFAAGVAVERLELVAPAPDRAADDVEQDVAMVALLEDVVRSEGVMLAFNDVVAERLAEARGEDEALAIVGRAAASGVGGLETLRPLIVAREGGPTVDEVRNVYLPHLDSWIDYLSAIADEPGLLFTRDDQQPYILLINATADAFRIALEDLVERGPSARIAELAERILDDGFRTEGPEPTL